MIIIATVGPRTKDKRILKNIIESGANILRLNCSHFNKKDFEETIKYARSLNNKVHILIDLCGKKIRISQYLKHIYKIYDNQEVIFCGEDYYRRLSLDEIDTRNYIPLNISEEIINISNINSISIKDNTMKFKIINVDNGKIIAKVINGGVIRHGKGCNISEIYKDENILSKNDKKNIEWAYNNNVDIICQSFVESKREIKEIQDYIYNIKKERNINIWAKVETKEGIKNINEILKVVNTVVIGRGDLVPECGLLNAVNLQEIAIKVIKEKNKKIIIGTHLLNSMKNGHVVTLPEVESIYKFINMNVDGFLLAGETSVGKNPIDTVKFLKDSINYYKERREKI